MTAYSDSASEGERTVARNEPYLVGLDVGTSKIAAIVGEMASSPDMLKRRLREGMEFFRFLRDRREIAH